MPAHIEFQLLSKIIADGDLRVAMDEGITDDYFSVVEARAVYSYLMDYYHDTKTRSLVPEIDIVVGKFPTVDFPTPSIRTTVKAMCQEVRSEHVRVKMEEIMAQAEETYEENPAGSLSRLIQDAKALQETAEESRDLILADSTETMKREYEMLEGAKGMLGIPWPVGWGYHTEDGKPKISPKTGRQHHPLNEESGGMRGGDFILLYGRPKSMKTWALVDMIVECYYHLNQRVLVFTKEMTPEQLRWRIVARMLGVDYTDLKSGQLPEAERDEFFDLLDTMKNEEERLMRRGQNRSMMITTGWTSGSVQSGIQSLQSKIDEFEPDIVMADSVYLMKASRQAGGGSQWQDIAEIAYGLHDLAVEYRIPIVATSQANRKGEELKGSSMAEIAYGDTFAQACDYAIRIIKTTDEDGKTFLSFIFSGAREIKLAGFKLEVEIAQKFMLDQIFTSQRQIMAQFKAEEEASAQEEAKEAAKYNKKRRLSLENLNNAPPEEE